MKVTITINVDLTLGANADFEYRPYINGCKVVEPYNWVSREATGDDGKRYTAWYYVENTSINLDEIDYVHPDDVTNEFGEMIWTAETGED